MIGRVDADPHHGGVNHEMRHFGPKEKGQHHQQNISQNYDLHNKQSKEVNTRIKRRPYKIKQGEILA